MLESSAKPRVAYTASAMRQNRLILERPLATVATFAHLSCALALVACTERPDPNAPDPDEEPVKTISTSKPPEDPRVATNRFFSQLAKEPVSGVVVLRTPVALYATESEARAAPRRVDGLAATFENMRTAKVIEDLGDIVKVGTGASYLPYETFAKGLTLSGYVRKSDLSPVIRQPYSQDFENGAGVAFAPGAAIVTEQDQFGVVGERMRAFPIPGSARGSMGLSADARDWKPELASVGLPLFCNGNSLEKRSGLTGANCALPEDVVLSVGEQSFRASMLVDRCTEVGVSKLEDGRLIAQVPVHNGIVRAAIERGQPTQRCEETAPKPKPAKMPKTVRANAPIFFQTGERAGEVGSASFGASETTKIGVRSCHTPTWLNVPLCHEPRDVR